MYDVLIENQPDGTVKATLLGLPDCQGLCIPSSIVEYL